MNTTTNIKLLQVGDKVASFEVKEIVKCYYKEYIPNSRGRFRRVEKDFAFILSAKGQERVIKLDKRKTTECETYYSTFGGSKYMTWNMMERV